MTRTRSRRGRRAGFTLIELLVVIAIIAILVSLTAAAVMKVFSQVPITQAKADIGQMESALQAFQQDYGLADPPPSYLLLSEDGSQYPGLMAQPAPVGPAATATVQFLKKWLGKNFNYLGQYDWNGNGTIDKPYTLQGEHCLVFYLGGIPTPPTGTNGCLGFSTNNTAPTLTGGNRRGPYFPFNSSRLLRDPTNGMFLYLDPYKTKNAGPGGGGQVYAFFSSGGVVNGYNLLTSAGGGDCAGIGANAYYELVTPAGGTPYANYAFNNKYQIICAGADGQFGGPQWSATTGAAGTGRDDQANFSTGILGGGQR